MQYLIAFLLVIVALAGISLVLALPTLLLWNWLCPELLHLPRIDIWQAWGLLALCGCLFKTTQTSK